MRTLFTSALFVLVLSIIVPSLTYAAPSVSPEGLGFGKCHSAGAPLNRSGLVNWFYTGGYTESFLDAEATRGVFDFNKWDHMLDSVFRNYPDSSFWLNVQTSQPDSVPQWAKDDPTLGYLVTSSSGSAFPIWNPNYQREFELLMTKYSEHIYSSSFVYRNKIKAVVIMGGGPYGEMISYGGCPSGDRCKKFEAQGYTDEKYYDAVVNWLVPLYARLFPDYPLVLQLGGGLGQPGYSGNVGKQAARTLIDRYGTRMYIKWNGWNYKYSTNPNSTNRYYHDFMLSIANEVRVGFEPASTAFTSGENQLVYNSILQTLDEIPISHFCLQTKFYDLLTDDQLRNLSSHFGGLQRAYPDFDHEPPPTSAPSPTSPTQPTPTTYVQPTAPIGQPSSGVLPPPYEVTNTPVPLPTSSSWIANLFTPKEPTPTIAFTTIPVTKKNGADIKALFCRAQSAPSSVIRTVVELPATFVGTILSVDSAIESRVNALVANVRLKIAR
ncbi:hypothetical protein KBB12_01505 [Candidatus Woesebacteria bacterium]|nr:hypothetical protein [Candidatus Woesebacteria bacterium]